MRARTLHLSLAPLALVLMSGCATEKPDVADSPNVADERLVGHVHGLGVDPADDALYAAGHYGVFRIDGGVPTRVAGRWQDTMAFTVTGPNTFLGSGHPDMREDRPTHLGLIESTDAAETWEPLSLAGEADFHALEVIGDRVVGYDSTSGQILTTTDRTSWDVVTRGQFIDLATAPGSDDQLLATTGKGQLVAIGLDGASKPLAGAPTLVWIDSTPDGRIVGTGPKGEVYVANRIGGRWEQRGTANGDPTTLEAGDTAWYLATHTGIYESSDDGATWSIVVDFAL